MDLALRGRRIAVTGASAGIGRAVAVTLAAEGARLTLGARRPEPLDRLAAELGGDALAVAADLATTAGVSALLAGAQRLGALDGLVCCVGSTPLGGFADLDDDAWQRAFDTKLLATIRMVRAALPLLRAGHDARVVVIGGTSAFDPRPPLLTSAVMNAALGALVCGLARELAGDHIGVVCVDPGPTDTARYDGLREAVADARGVDAATAGEILVSGIPTGRVTSAQEVAVAVAACLSPRLTQLTGTRIAVDGAMTWAR